MAHMNHGHPGFAPPGQNMRMMRPFGPPRFNPSCPWRPPHQERPFFNISRFMYPPHTNPSPEFTSDDIFGPGSFTASHNEHFPYNNQPNHQYLGRGGPHFQEHGGTPRRGFMRGNRGGQGFWGNHHGGNDNSYARPVQSKKKERINKRDLPENNAFYCDTCDRGFKLQEKYQEHVDSHMQCTFKDCSYIAAPKLVQLHMNLQHRSGLAKRVWRVETVEDVKKWLEDRKRNYPTAENIARKSKNNEEKMVRGEMLQTKNFSKMRFKGRDRRRGMSKGYGKEDRNRHKNRSWEERGQGESHEDVPHKEINSSAFCDQKETLKTMEQTEGTDASLQAQNRTDEKAEGQSGSLALLASYGASGSEADSDFVEDEAIDSSSQCHENESIKSTEQPGVPQITTESSISSSKAKAISLPNPSASSSPTQTHPSSALSDRDVNPPTDVAHKTDALNNNNCSSDIVTTSSENSVRTTEWLRKNKQLQEKEIVACKREHNNKGGPSAKKRKIQPRPHTYTLLEKLLASDIRRERNKILQCVHYIVKHKFFETDHTKGQSVPAGK